MLLCLVNNEYFTLSEEFSSVHPIAKQIALRQCPKTWPNVEVLSKMHENWALIKLLPFFIESKIP